MDAQGLGTQGGRGEPGGGTLGGTELREAKWVPARQVRQGFRTLGCRPAPPEGRAGPGRLRLSQELGLRPPSRELLAGLAFQELP